MNNGVDEPALPLDISSVRGFLSADEGCELYRSALEVASCGPLLEVGCYCGRSTVYLGSAARCRGAILFAVDHHRGSEEHQPGEEYHDPQLLDDATGRMDSFREFRRTLARADLEQTVVPVVASSEVASRQWATPLSMVFIDGGHSRIAALADYHGWVRHLVPDGILAIHDIFDSPAEGGQAPREIANLALASGQFREQRRVESLGIFRRLPAR